MKSEFMNATTAELEKLKEGLDKLLESSKQREANETSDERDPTELGNAKRFADALRTEFLFVRQMDEKGRWLYWDGRLWKSDVDGMAVRSYEQKVLLPLKVELAEMQAEFALTDDDSPGYKDAKERVDAKRRWCRSSQSKAVIANTLTLAATQEEMSASISEFDADGYLFGCANGIVDLRTGQLHDTDARPRVTKSTTVAYDPTAKCPEWERFLLKIMDGNQDDVGFLQRLAGQCMLGLKKDKFIIFWGNGANGKSTFVDTLKFVLGDYATATDPDILMNTNRDKREYYLADLKGSRLAFMNESSYGDRIAAATVKMLTDSGEVAARFPRGEVFKFQPVFTLILSTNDRPKVDSDDAVFRRVLLVAFTYTIPKDERNPTFRTDVLMPEMEGILRWCVDGAIAYLDEGLKPTANIIDATEDYQKDQDKVGLFLDELFVPAPGKKLTLKTVLDRCNKWCEDNNLKPMSNMSLKPELGRKGFTVDTGTDNKLWVYNIDYLHWKDRMGLQRGDHEETKAPSKGEVMESLFDLN